MSFMAILKSSDIKRSARIKASTTGSLLDWYDKNRRELPWRAKPGQTSDPYRVWLSEIMLQQTTVAAVGRYYRAFLKRWPDVHSLAAASLDDVLGAWAGLGYYSRARNLHRAAHVVVHEREGVFPRTSEELRALPGVGGYTAAAIAAIAFGERVPAIDANAERVLARLSAVTEPLPKAKKALAELAGPLVPADRPGDFAQALMDLGAMVCLPKQPLCMLCPLNGECRARALGIAEMLPQKTSKPDRPLKRGAAYVALDGRGAVYLVKRPENGLLGGMLQPPLGPWQAEFPSPAAARRDVPFTGEWRKKLGLVRHGFTHFELELEVYVAHFARRPSAEGHWWTLEELTSAALPTVMRKVVAHALERPRGRLQLSSARTR
jgi:A/G-specific adenine glycosylase